MSVPRLQGGRLLPSISRQHICPFQIRNIRTIPPQRSVWFPLLTSSNYLKRKATRSGINAQEEKVPVVPPLGPGDKLKRQTKHEARQRLRTRKALEKMNREELDVEMGLRESEKRIEEYEEEERLREGKSQQQINRETQGDLSDEVVDNISYPRDVIGQGIKKIKPKYQVNVYATKNYISFLADPTRRKQVAQAAVEIIESYQKKMQGDKLETMLNGSTQAVQLPSELAIENADTRCLSLPFPPEAILPTMRLVFESLKNQCRYALADKQINAIRTGADFLKYLLNPPPRVVHPNRPTYLYNTLSQISFPPNVTILPDKKLERIRQQQQTISDLRRSKVLEKVKAELRLKAKKKRREKLARQKRIRKNLEELKEYLEKKKALEEHANKKLFSFLGQFYGRLK